MASELRLTKLFELTNYKTYYMNLLSNVPFPDVAYYDVSITDCAQVGWYSIIWTMCALSTVLSRTIVSDYPCVNGPNDVAATVLTVNVQPRINYSFHGVKSIRIFGTKLQRV